MLIITKLVFISPFVRKNKRTIVQELNENKMNIELIIKMSLRKEYSDDL